MVRVVLGILKLLKKRATEDGKEVRERERERQEDERERERSVERAEVWSDELRVYVYITYSRAILI